MSRYIHHAITLALPPPTHKSDPFFVNDKVSEIFKGISPKIDQAYATLIGKLG